MRNNPNLSAEDDIMKMKMKMGIVDDYLCAICDQGGFLIRCDGECGRVFHPQSFHGKYSMCGSLELKDDQVEKSSNFLCKNCEYKRHQCFVCGKLGSSEMPLGSPEVIKCQNKYCGRFYHPNCLLTYDPSKIHQDFECPLHECHSCKNKRGTTIAARKPTEKEEETYLVQCRRCPVAYHQKCLPRNISKVANCEVSRAWKIETINDSEVPYLHFFYCRKHKMVRKLQSATRDHLKFPERHVYKFDLNEKLPEETVAADPNASTSYAPMESSASQSTFPCPQPGYGGRLDD